MKRSIHRRESARIVHCHAVFGEAGPDVVRRRLNRHVDPHPDVPRHRAAVAIQGGNDLHDAAVAQRAAIPHRTADVGEIVDAGRRKAESVPRRGETRRVGHGRHLDGRLGAVHERIEHLRVEVASADLLRRKPVVLPDGSRRGFVIGGQMPGALAGGDDLEAAGARPIDHFAYQRGLIAVGERVHDFRSLRLRRQHGADERVRLHVGHHDVATVAETGARVVHARHGVAGRLDDDVDPVRRDQFLRVLGQPDRAAPASVGRIGRGVPGFGPSGLSQRASRAVHGEVRDADEADAGHAPRLSEKHRPELSGADKAHANGTPRLLAILQHPGQVHLRLPVPGASRDGHAVGEEGSGSPDPVSPGLPALAVRCPPPPTAIA